MRIVCSRRRIAGLLIVAACVAAVAVASSWRTDGSASVSVGEFSVATDLSAAEIRLASTATVTATGPGGQLPLRDGLLVVPLHLAANGQQTIRVAVSAGAHLGDLEIRYYPRSLYVALGSPNPATILLYTSLPRMGQPLLGPGAQATVSPQASLTIDAAPWSAARAAGEFPSASSGLDEQLRGLYRRFDQRNDTSIGRLCDESASGIATYREMSARACFVWCTGYSSMVRDFLRSEGIPARLVDLVAQDTTLPDGTLVESSEGHQTTELWDGTRWTWIDGTLRVLRALDPAGRSMSLKETIIALADPNTRDSVRFTRLDPTTGAWNTRAYRDQDEPFRIALATDITPDKTIDVPNGGAG